MVLTKALCDSQGNLVNVIAYDPDGTWQPPAGYTLRDVKAGDETFHADPLDVSWRQKVSDEIAFIETQLGTWPADATTNTQAIARVNFLLSAVKRLARNQERILKFITDQVKDAGA